MATSYYYYVQFSSKPPALLFVPTAVLVASLPLIASLIQEPHKWQHWASGALSSVNLAVLVFILVPRELYLKSIVENHTLADVLKEAAAAQEVIKLGHVGMALVTLIELVLQVSAARVVAGASKAKKSS